MQRSRSALAAALVIASTMGCGDQAASNDAHDAATESGQSDGEAGPPLDCSGLPGPAMVRVSSPKGASYCIDATEVTQQQYAVFLATHPSAAAADPPECASNLDLNPFVDTTPCGSGGAAGCEHDCNATTFTPDTTPNRPVVCVDWCDARAYCKWAGKRLCGKIGGGAVNPYAFADPSQSEWFNACSRGGSRVYPYGQSYDPNACEGLDVTQSNDAGANAKMDVAMMPACHGSDEYSAIWDQSGGVAELEDACAAGSCRVRGGSLRSAASALTCASDGGALASYQHFSDIGFRCCKD